MRKILLILILLALIAPSLALTDYQRGVLDGLNRGWFMAQRYDQAQAGNPTAYNQAVLEYNTWIESLFGKNESLMLKTFLASPRGQPYSISKTFTPIHEMDASWNQTRLAQQPQPDANGLINGYPAEIYDSWGPALSSF